MNAERNGTAMKNEIRDPKDVLEFAKAKGTESDANPENITGGWITIHGSWRSGFKPTPSSGAGGGRSLNGDCLQRIATMPRKLASRMKFEKYASSRMYAGIQRISATSRNRTRNEARKILAARMRSVMRDVYCRAGGTSP